MGISYCLLIVKKRKRKESCSALWRNIGGYQPEVPREKGFHSLSSFCSHSQVLSYFLTYRYMLAQTGRQGEGTFPGEL
jgi:hypothetical protein